MRLLVIDVTSEDSVNAAAQKFASEHAHLDVLVNNAGIAPESHTHDASAPDLEVLPQPSLFFFCIISFVFIIFYSFITFPSSEWLIC